MEVERIREPPRGYGGHRAGAGERTCTQQVEGVGKTLALVLVVALGSIKWRLNYRNVRHLFQKN